VVFFFVLTSFFFFPQPVTQDMSVVFGTDLEPHLPKVWGFWVGFRVRGSRRWSHCMHIVCRVTAGFRFRFRFS
jgi:hypothetical protein